MTAARAFLQLYGPTGFKLNVAGLYDENEERVLLGALEHVGFGANLTRQTVQQLGVFVCVKDLEEEMVRALGTHATEQIIDRNGDLAAFQTPPAATKPAAAINRGAASRVHLPPEDRVRAATC